jgi:hypothetical protein
VQPTACWSDEVGFRITETAELPGASETDVGVGCPWWVAGRPIWKPADVTQETPGKPNSWQGVLPSFLNMIGMAKFPVAPWMPSIVSRKSAVWHIALDVALGRVVEVTGTDVEGDSVEIVDD